MKQYASILYISFQYHIHRVSLNIKCYILIFYILCQIFSNIRSIMLDILKYNINIYKVILNIFHLPIYHLSHNTPSRHSQSLQLGRTLIPGVKIFTFKKKKYSHQTYLYVSKRTYSHLIYIYMHPIYWHQKAFGNLQHIVYTYRHLT